MSSGARSTTLVGLAALAIGFAAAHATADEGCIAQRSTLRDRAVNLHQDSRLRPREAMPRIAPGTQLCVLRRARTGNSLHSLWAYEVRHPGLAGWVSEYALEPPQPPASPWR